jgi:hypothetical protein
MNRVIYIQEFPVVEENNSYWHDSGLLRVKKAPSVLDKLKASPLSRSVLEAATESLPKISTGKAESKKKATVRNASSADSGILPAAIHKVPHSVKFEAECAPSSSETLPSTISNASANNVFNLATFSSPEGLKVNPTAISPAVNCLVISPIVLSVIHLPQ